MKVKGATGVHEACKLMMKRTEQHARMRDFYSEMNEVDFVSALNIELCRVKRV